MMEELQPKPKVSIVGINLLVLVVYTILFRLVFKYEAIILIAIFNVVHCVVCFTVGVASLSDTDDTRKMRLKQWLLSALLVFLIGFATCWLGAVR